MIVVVEATGQCEHFETVPNVQCGEEIVLLRKAFDMWMLTEPRVNEGGRKRSKRV